MPRKLHFAIKKYDRKKWDTAVAAKRAARQACEASNVVLPSSNELANELDVVQSLKPEPLDCLIQNLQSHLKNVHNSQRRMKYKLQKPAVLDMAGQWHLPESEEEIKPAEELTNYKLQK